MNEQNSQRGSGASQDNGRETRETVTINVPAGVGLPGLGSVISVLLMAGIWGIVGIGYICVPGSLVAGVIGVGVGLMNVGNGLAAAALALGCGIACIGLCVPCLRGTNILHKFALKQTKGALH